MSMMPTIIWNNHYLEDSLNEYKRGENGSAVEFSRLLIEILTYRLKTGK